MVELIKINLQKQIWEFINNRFRVLLSFFVYGVTIYLFYHNSITRNGDSFFGLDYQSAIVVFIVLWLIISSFAQIGSIIVHEAKIGTIEKLIISPYGLKNILLSRLLIQLGLVVVFSAFIFIISGLITGTGLSIDLISIFIVITVGMLSLYGISIALAGISLISKEINLISSIARIGLIYAIFVCEDNALIPFSLAKSILINIVLYQETIWSFSPTFMIAFFINSVGYFLLGLVVFRYIEIFAVRKGRIIGY